MIRFDLTVCHCWKSGGTPRSIYIFSVNSTPKGPAMTFYHDCGFGVKRWGIGRNCSRQSGA